jgi:hypothetical protein
MYTALPPDLFFRSLENPMEDGWKFLVSVIESDISFVSLVYLLIDWHL